MNAKSIIVTLLILFVIYSLYRINKYISIYRKIKAGEKWDRIVEELRDKYK